MCNSVDLVKRLGSYSAGNERPRKNVQPGSGALRSRSSWQRCGKQIRGAGLPRSRQRLLCLSVQQLFTVAKTASRQERVPQEAASEGAVPAGPPHRLRGHLRRVHQAGNYSNKLVRQDKPHPCISWLSSRKCQREKKILLRLLKQDRDSEVRGLW